MVFTSWMVTAVFAELCGLAKLGEEKDSTDAKAAAITTENLFRVRVVLIMVVLLINY